MSSATISVGAGVLRYILASLLAFLALAAPALSQPAAIPSAPAIGPAPEWVEALPLPAPNAKLSDRPLQSLLTTTQSRYSKDGTREYYVELATLVQNPSGLETLGTVALPWQPAQYDLLVHKVQIVRNGAIIDLLKTQSFTVLRREDGLEGAMLNGVLTAVMQPEGLMVGDIVRLAWTIRSKPQAYPFKAENNLVLSHGDPTRRVYYRELWEEGVELRSRATPYIGKPKSRMGPWGRELVLDIEDAEGPEPPEGAPPRYREPALLETSAYRDWAEIGRMIAPAYAAATRLSPDSTLKVEIDRIATASPDPGKRTLAALRLVQEKIRYFALAMGEGGYTPASADQTWMRKFGDCKGKTAVLLALLSGLGINAEPVLVSTAFADSLNEHLPQARLFDHVIVRATIGGRTYWLDGTRVGDRRLEPLASSPFGWGLPLTPAGSSLEPLPLLPASEPLVESTLTFDASKGFSQPVPFTGRLIYRDDLAVAVVAAAAENGRDALLKDAKANATIVPNEEDITNFDMEIDDEGGSVTFVFSGTSRMKWPSIPGEDAVRYRFNDSTIQSSIDFSRKKGPLEAAPFLMPFPAYFADTQTVILPDGGRGFTIQGEDFDRQIGGVRITRKLSIQGGRATARSSWRTAQRELAAKEAPAAAAAFQEANDDRAYIRSPLGYKVSQEERAAILASKPTSAAGLVDHGYHLLQEGRSKDALIDFDKAAELEPKWALPHANRAIALVHLKRLEEAEAAVATAASLGEDFVTHQAYGLIHLQRDRPKEAVKAFSRSLELDPNNSFNLAHRATAYEQQGQLEEALADIERGVALQPHLSMLSWREASLRAALGQEDQALAATARMTDANSDDPFGYGFRGEMLARFGRSDDANAEFAKALAVIDLQANKPQADEALLFKQKIAILSMSGRHREAIEAASERLGRLPGNRVALTARCSARMIAMIEIDAALHDCSEAVRNDSGNANALAVRATLKLRPERWDEAIADYDAALRLEPRDPTCLYGRGVAKQRKGEREAAANDLAAAKRYGFDIAAKFEMLAIKP
jgi:tetratricopeptide (TPR) repeat protein